MKTDTKLLGKQVLPILRRGMISGTEADKQASGGAGAWLTGEDSVNHYRRVVSAKEKEILKDNREMDWYIFSVNADGKFNLRTYTGYEQGNLSRSDFRLIKNGKVW